MKSKFNAKKLILIMLVIVGVSLILTAVIVGKLTKEANARIEKYWFFRESVKAGQPLTIKNAYLLSCEDGELLFVHEGQTFRVDGKLESDVVGITDIVVDGDDIVKIYAKPDEKEGVLESYDEASLCLSTATDEEIIKRNDEIPVYRVNGNMVSQVDWNQFIVGVSKINCVMESGSVCAILIEEDVLPSDIRVVIKNDTSTFYQDLYIKKASDGSALSVREILDEEGKSSLQISDPEGLYLINQDGAVLQEAFLGDFRVIQTENGMVLVNELPIEEYLKYVVPSEMPLSFGIEALKAQAVCARTYAYSQLYNQTYAMYGANVDDTTSFQVYHNVDRQAITDTAVKETEGEVITRDGALITSLYYSTAPGDTQSPFSSWRAYLDMDKAKHKEYGKLEEIEILKKNEDGYATEVKLVYEKGTETVSNEYKIRMKILTFMKEVVLSDESVRTNFPILPSAYFDVKETQEGELYLEGGGYGHGIGMSQYGAKAMAEQGDGYREIIGYYYKDVVVEQR